MNILSIVKAVIPSLTKEKQKVEAIDSIISKRGNTTAFEVYGVLIYKVIRLLLIGYIAIAVIYGKVSIADILKVLSLGI